MEEDEEVLAEGSLGRETELGPAERTLLEEMAAMVAHAFCESHRDAAKMLGALAEALSVDAAGVYVETILSMLLTLPSPKHKCLYYYCLLIDLCKLLPAFPLCLERALNSLFDHLPYLEPELSLRLAEWLAFHVSNWGFSLSPFAKPWGDAVTARLEAKPALAQRLDMRAQAAAEVDSHVLFVRYLLERMVRLSYVERVARDLPEAFTPLLPPKPVGKLDWDEPRDTDTERGSPAHISQSLINRLRARATPEEVTGWLEREVADPKQRVALVVQTLLHAGSKSVSHLEKLLDKFGWLLQHVATDAPSKALVVGAGLRYWCHSTQMGALLTRKLVEARVVDAASALSAMFGAKGIDALLQFDCWEAILASAEMAVHLQTRAAKTLEAERRQCRAVVARADAAGLRRRA
mmetsp:Transcript_65716/g.173480  ORF Transcript_65716/g.173480 Transcript_65716/m.173480 type:complete len:407 (-) Transcript_65716:130-1350(-)